MAGPAVDWLHRHRTVLGLVGAAASLGLSLLWLVVVPDRVQETTGLQQFLIRWGHSLCWLLLAGVGVLVAVDGPKRLRDIVAVAAGCSYAAFLAATVL